MTAREALRIAAVLPAVVAVALACALSIALLLLACTAWLWGPALVAVWLLS